MLPGIQDIPVCLIVFRDIDGNERKRKLFFWNGSMEKVNKLFYCKLELLFSSIYIYMYEILSCKFSYYVYEDIIYIITIYFDFEENFMISSNIIVIIVIILNKHIGKLLFYISRFLFYFILNQKISKKISKKKRT